MTLSSRHDRSDNRIKPSQTRVFFAASFSRHINRTLLVPFTASVENKAFTMSGRKSNPYRTTGKPEKLKEPSISPVPPARKIASARHLATQPGAMAMVGGKAMNTDDMEFGTEDDLPTNVGRRLVDQPDVEAPEPPPTPTPTPTPRTPQRAPQVSQASSQPVNSVTAVLVDEDAEDRKIEKRLEEERKDIPLAEPVKEVPWWKRQSTILAICIVLLIIIAVSVAVPLTKKNNAANFPTAMPTSSPAPTALAVITLVLQLDDKPWETGWKLECDNNTVVDAPPGTYALVAGRPNFRIEYQAVLVVGIECQFTIADTGGDGINPGYYAIYNGDDTGDPSSLITRGNVSGGNQNSPISFTPGTLMGSMAPTAAPTVGSGTTPALCTVCPDGTPVPFPDEPAQGWGSLTCEELDFLAALTTSPAVCRNMQDAAAYGCGCRNFCTTMCPDRISDIDPQSANETVFIRNDQRVTCATYQTDISSARANSQDQCLSANFLGEDVCGCPSFGPFCRICEGTGGNASTNPPAKKLAETEVVPGVSCLDITGIAYTLKRDDPRTGFFQLCPACLSIGAYCGCEIPPDGRDWCRLCGGPGDLLPVPSRIVNSSVLGYQTTCYDVEFRSNIADNTTTLPCDEYKQDAAEACCSP